jgi:hypothetical protein
MFSAAGNTIEEPSATKYGIEGDEYAASGMNDILYYKLILNIGL